MHLKMSDSPRVQAIDQHENPVMMCTLKAAYPLNLSHLPILWIDFVVLVLGPAQPTWRPKKMCSSFFFDSYITLSYVHTPKYAILPIPSSKRRHAWRTGINFQYPQKNANSQQHSKRQLQNSSTRFLVANANSARSPTSLLCRFEVWTLCCLLHTTRSVKW